MEKYDKVIRYAEGEMTDNEKLAYESEMSANKEVKKAMDLIAEIDTSLKNEEQIKLIENLNKAQNKCNEEENAYQINSKNNLFIGKKFLLAAGITLLLAISSLVYFFNSQIANDKIFADYYIKYESNVITRSNNSTSDELIIAIQLYDKGKYTEAILKLDGIVKKDNTNAPAHFFLGVSFIETKEYTKAIESLKNVIRLQDPAFEEHANWYLALCYIKTNQNDLASPILKQIAKGESYYRINANDLLKSLE